MKLSWWNSVYWLARLGQYWESTCLFWVHSSGTDMVVLNDSFELGYPENLTRVRASPTPLPTSISYRVHHPSRLSNSTSGSWWKKLGRPVVRGPWCRLPRSPSQTRSSGCFQIFVPPIRDPFSEKTNRSQSKSLSWAPHPAHISHFIITITVVII